VALILSTAAHMLEEQPAEERWNETGNSESLEVNPD